MIETKARRSRALSPLFRMALLTGVRPVVELQLRHGSDVNAVDDKGRSPLILAASRGHHELCRLLLDKGAAPLHRDDCGKDCLAAAGSGAKPELIALLQEAIEVAQRHVPAEEETSVPPVEVPEPDSFKDLMSAEEASRRRGEGDEGAISGGPPIDEVGAPARPRFETSGDIGRSLRSQASDVLLLEPATPQTSAAAVADGRSDFPVLAYWMPSTDPPSPVLPDAAPARFDARADERTNPAPSAAVVGSIGATEGSPDAGGPAIDPEGGFFAGIDLANWLPEADAAPPAPDPACEQRARDGQALISQHTPVNRDQGWSDVLVELPDASESLARVAGLKSSEELDLWNLVAGGIRVGRVSESALARIFERWEFDNRKRPAAIEAGVRIVLNDLGIAVDDEADLLESPSADSLEENDAARVSAEVEDALSFLVRLYAESSDYPELYQRQINGPLLSREEETQLGLAIEAGKKEALVAAARSSAVAGRIVSLIDAISEGTERYSAISDLLDTLRTEPLTGSDGHDPVDEDNDSRQGQSSGAPSALPQELHAIRGLCTKILAGPPSSERDGCATELGRMLFALDPPPSFVDMLHRVVAAGDAVDTRRRMEQGLEQSRRARDRLVRANLRLALSVARKRGGPLPLLDRIQESSLGLMKAADRFDPGRGRFSTYAVWWIRQSMSRAIADTGRVIRIPVHVRDALWKIHKTMRALGQEGEGRPDYGELSRLTEIPAERIVKLLNIPDDPVSSDDDDVRALVEQIPDPASWSPETNYADRQRRELIDDILSTLPERAVRIIRLRFGFDGDEHTLEEVGEIYGVTRERIRQIEAKALEKLRVRDGRTLRRLL